MEEDEDNPAVRNPDVDGEDGESGLKISNVPFEELIKVFPNTHEVCFSSSLRTSRMHVCVDVRFCGIVAISRRRSRSSSRLMR